MSLGIDNNVAFCVFGLYDATIIVSVSFEDISSLTPIISTVNGSKSANFFSSCPIAVCIIPLTPHPFL